MDARPSSSPNTGATRVEKIIRFENIRPSSIDASIEMAPSQAIDSPDLPGLLPPGVRIYVTDIGLADTPTLVKAARRVTDLGEEAAIAALRMKSAWAERSGARMRIVTQFGFDADKFIAWADGLAALGLDLPVHLGVAGPAKITTLLKYAALCGVGNSLNFLKKRSVSLAALATSHSP